MHIIIEEHKYAVSKVKEVLKGIDALEDVEGYVSINYVGYFYNTDANVHDCVFILPKVLLEDKDGQELVFGKYPPEDIIDLDANNPLSQKEKDFIYEFAVWIYRAIVVFHNDKQNDTSIVYQKNIVQVGKGNKHLGNTFLDILLSLIQFNKKNQSFFFFVLHNLHAGFNKINWNKTIATTNAVVQNNSAIYLNPINKKRQINFDEELLVIFFSILNYIHEYYGFPVHINCNFQLIKGRQFRTYLKGFGKIRLLRIKYKYFSDKALQLWNLCYSFFDTARQIHVSTEQKEYLLVKNFNIVFEAIIDELIGDRDIPAGLKDQDDGKRIDHMYSYDGLITNDEPIYYIGDSKYYKRGNPIGKESVYKQFTYAKNVIQWNLNLFMNNDANDDELQNDKKNFGNVPKLRDDVTEGYNIIPNFFISAKLNEELSYKDEVAVSERSKTEFTNRQFENRLFDRDTLLVCHYDVNFLYVVSLYAKNNSYNKKVWKEKVRNMFRKHIQEMLSKKYNFYAMKSNGNPVAGELFIKEHFYEFMGKLYRPYDDKNIYVLALEKHDEVEENPEVHQMLSNYFQIDPLKKLGDNPKEKLELEVAQYQQNHPYKNIPPKWLPQYHLARFPLAYVVVGMYHDQQHWDWITGKNDKGSLIYNVRLDQNREGAQVKNRLRQLKVKFAILYKEGNNVSTYHVFRVHDTAVMTEDRMKKAMYPTNHGGPHGSYFIFRFDDEISIGNFDINQLISNREKNDSDFVKGAPIFLTCEDLLKFKV
nr:restriction endonuclease [uncultured Prevotella sp.]